MTLRSKSRIESSVRPDTETSKSYEKFYELLRAREAAPKPPFGFGSQSPSRIEPKYPDTPGPGKYDIRSTNFHIESIRGKGNGFTSMVPRKLEWAKGNKNPSPSSYLPSLPNRKVQPKIGKLTTYGRKCSCYPDERETSITPGPASYNLPELKDRCTTSVFKSKSQRQYLPKHKHQPRFDGKTFTITRFDFDK